jgi:hypothetical protein
VAPASTRAGRSLETPIATRIVPVFQAGELRGDQSPSRLVGGEEHAREELSRAEDEPGDPAEEQEMQSQRVQPVCPVSACSNATRPALAINSSPTAKNARSISLGRGERGYDRAAPAAAPLDF